MFNPGQSKQRNMRNMKLESLPEFMNAPSAQVKFHSAFPPLTTRVPAKTVMERAGFDVYKPEKNRSTTKNLTDKKRNFTSPNLSFHPPKQGGRRNYSGSQKLNSADSSLYFKNKGRNFTTVGNHSLPNIGIYNESHQNKNLVKEDGESNDSQTTRLPNISLNNDDPDQSHDFQQRHRSSTFNSQFSNLRKAPVPPAPSSKLANSFTNNDVDSDIDPDVSTNSVIQNIPISQIQEPSQKIAYGDVVENMDNSIGYQVSGEFTTPEENDAANYRNSYSTEPLFLNESTKDNTHIDSEFIDKTADISINTPPRMVIPNIIVDSSDLTPTSEQDQFASANDQNETPRLYVENIDKFRMSVMSDSSLDSFDRKFMTPMQSQTPETSKTPRNFETDDIDNDLLSQLTGMKDVIGSPEFLSDSYSHAELNKNGKHLSTMATDDFNVYNLPEELNFAKNESEMSNNQEKSFEDSVQYTSSHLQNENNIEILPQVELIDSEDSESLQDLDTDKFDQEFKPSLTNSANITDDKFLEAGFIKHTVENLNSPNLKRESVSNQEGEFKSFELKKPPTSVVDNDVNDMINTLDQLNNSIADKTSILTSESVPSKSTNIPEEKSLHLKSNIYPPGEGPCRLCQNSILKTEKKIWSKDNQLSGQWHRSCFGCSTCAAKFSKGSSCYVFEDLPYCERHFHELNGSLCKACNRGVEGECMQNDLNEVFHVDCLLCVTCGKSVDGDYYMYKGHVICQNDATQLIREIESGEKIEKRKTRIMYL